MGGTLAGLALAALGSSTAPVEQLVPLGRLSTTALQPAVGERVELELPWAGPWPPQLDWSGVDEVQDNRAWVRLNEPGPHRVEVRGVELVLEVVEQAEASPEPPSTLVTSLPQLQATCADERYPQVAGLWVVGCSGRAAVDTAVHLETRQVVQLLDPADAPGVGGEGIVVAPDRRWTLPEGKPERHRRPLTGIAPWATDGRSVVVSTEQDVQWFPVGEHARQHLRGSPAPWMPPAAGDVLAWVEVGERSLLGEDIFVWREGLRDGVPLVRRPGDQRHVAADAEHVAWIEEERVCVEDVATGLRHCTETDAHSSRGLSLDQGVACWEHWNGQDTDIWCSDGLRLERPEHQRSPARSGPWLVFQDRGRVLVAELSPASATPAEPAPPD